MDERRKSKNVNNERKKKGRKKGTKNSRKQKINEESHNAKNAYLRSTCDEISRTELY
jgi:hypothetical protein